MPWCETAQHGRIADPPFWLRANEREIAVDPIKATLMIEEQQNWGTKE
jgi:hypothetical protein